MRIPLLIFLTALSVAHPTFAQSVVVGRRSVTYTRKRAAVDHKRTFKINYPVVKAAVPAVSSKIMTELDYFRLFDFKLAEELGSMHWLEDADFEVKINDKGILSVAMWIEGSGAYPDGVTKFINMDSTKGSRVSSIELFSERGKLTTIVAAKMQAAVDAAVKVIKEDKENNDLDTAELLGKYKFTLRSLDNFYVTDSGVTFVYEFNFPHVIKALEPDNEYSMTWSELGPFIRRDGLLAGFVR